MEESESFVFLTMKKRNIRAINYHTYRRSLKHEDTVSNYIVKLAKNEKSQVEAQFFNPTNSIQTIGLLVTPKLYYDTNNIYKGKGM